MAPAPPRGAAARAVARPPPTPILNSTGTDHPPLGEALVPESSEPQRPPSLPPLFSCCPPNAGGSGSQPHHPQRSPRSPFGREWTDLLRPNHPHRRKGERSNGLGATNGAIAYGELPAYHKPPRSVARRLRLLRFVLLLSNTLVFPPSMDRTTWQSMTGGVVRSETLGEGYFTPPLAHSSTAEDIFYFQGRLNPSQALTE